jgi:hypothetical protein
MLFLVGNHFYTQRHKRHPPHLGALLVVVPLSIKKRIDKRAYGIYKKNAIVPSCRAIAKERGYNKKN